MIFFTRKFLKFTITALAVFLFFVSVVFSAETIGITANKIGNKYQYEPPAKIAYKGEEITYEINEYQSNKGNGYWIIYKKPIETTQLNSTTTKIETIEKTLTKSEGYGVEAKEHNYDWQ